MASLLGAGNSVTAGLGFFVNPKPAVTLLPAPSRLAIQGNAKAAQNPSKIIITG